MRFLLCVFYMALLGSITHFIGESLPREKLPDDKFIFRCFSWEQEGKIYERVGVQKWKDKLPDMSRIIKNMTPKRFEKAISSKAVHLLINETKIAECSHIALLFLSHTVYLVCPNTLGTITAVLYALSHIPYIIIQRYNRPKLTALYKKLLLREEKHK